MAKTGFAPKSLFHHKWRGYCFKKVLAQVNKLVKNSNRLGRLVATKPGAALSV
jgi:hypothetical protein